MANGATDAAGDGGRRAVRDDGAALDDAFQGRSEIEAEALVRLSKKEQAVMLELIELFERTGAPIPQRDRDAIFKKHYPRHQPATLMADLRTKRALFSDEGDGQHTRVVWPNMKATFLDSQSGKRVWPMLESRSSQVVSQPTPEPAPAQTIDPNAEPVALARSLFVVYEALLRFAREHEYRPLLHHEVRTRFEQSGVRDVNGGIYQLVQAGLLKVVGGTSRSRKNPSIRAVVFRPYKMKTGEAIVPQECLPQEDDDMSRRDQVEEELRGVREQQQQLRERLVETAEAERTGRIEEIEAQIQRLQAELAGLQRPTDPDTLTSEELAGLDAREATLNEALELLDRVDALLAPSES